jgi:hypothetical protein
MFKGNFNYQRKYVVGIFDTAMRTMARQMFVYLTRVEVNMADSETLQQ